MTGARPMIHYIAPILSLLSVASRRPSGAEEGSISYTAPTSTFLAGRVAIDQGLFRQENLDVKFVRVRTAALTPALANGHIDDTMSFVPPIDSALGGSPVQMAGVFDARCIQRAKLMSSVQPLTKVADFSMAKELRTR